MARVFNLQQKDVERSLQNGHAIPKGLTEWLAKTLRIVNQTEFFHYCCETFGPAITVKPRAKFVVEWKMIVNKDLNSGDPTLKKWMTAIRHLHLAKRCAPSSAKNLLPPLPIDSLQWTQLAPTFDPRTVRHLNRIMGNLDITTLPDKSTFVPKFEDGNSKFRSLALS